MMRALAMMMLLCAANAALAQSDPIKGSAALTSQAGFARLLLTLDDDSEPEVTAAGNILVIRFKRKAEIALDGIVGAMPDYVGAVRRDPDGMAIRFALQRKVTLNAMSAGERTYVDLLPDKWSGLPPGLPAEVVRELAERARVAERALRQQRNATAPKPRAPIRVRASQQPTFLRFSFDLPEGVNASSAIADRKLTVSFDAPLAFELSDVKTISSAKVVAITPKSDASTSAIEMTLIGGDSELRAFREDKNYVVDLIASRSDVSQQIERAAPSQPVATPPETVEIQSAKPEIMLPAGNVAQASSQAIAEILKQPSDQPQTQPSRAAIPTAIVKRESDALHIQLAVPTSVAAALFRRADKIWLVVDSQTPIDAAEIQRAGSGLLADAQIVPLDRAQAIRLRLKRPLLPSLSEGERGWTLSLADAAPTPAQPLIALRDRKSVV